MKLSDLETYVAQLRAHATAQGAQDAAVTFSLHRNHASAVLQTSKHFLDLQLAQLHAPLRCYTGGAQGPDGEDSFRFLLPLEAVDIGTG